MKSSEPTIRDHVVSLLPRMALKKRRYPPKWPPDAFAICLSLLQNSAAYCRVLTDWPPVDEQTDWADFAEETGQEWRRRWVNKQRPPKDVISCWEVLMKNLDRPVSFVRENEQLSQRLLVICAVADEACVDVGTPVNREMDENDDESYYDFKFAEHADVLLNRNTGASLCDEIDPARARVLPKQHTPQMV
jgi:hypothetical protein